MRKLSVRRSGKLAGGKMSGWGFVAMRNCQGGEMSGCEIAALENIWVGNCRVGCCPVGNRRVGNCRFTLIINLI